MLRELVVIAYMEKKTSVLFLTTRCVAGLKIKNRVRCLLVMSQSRNDVEGIKREQETIKITHNEYETRREAIIE